ncbi:MAG TPA: UPF0158 family protein [Paludibacteraceae bacterium]|nr:UPF0158 family protein [Paludibacteraceae bacterium]HOL00228.1 UPF0158 family protein [Paludibacteraceae bacterium]HPO67301.1 UPF0158 family protein [Paludibacteraceae bacterium]
MKPTEKQIKNIAESLDSGMRSFFHLKTGEIKELPNFENWLDTSTSDLWDDDVKEIEKNSEDYFEFEDIDSYEFYQIMTDFAESVEDIRLQERLLQALSGSKPFRNFKWQIEYSGNYREKWFDFKMRKYVEWVKEQIEENKEKFNE